MNVQRLEKKLLREAKDWFKTDPKTVHVIKKLKKASPPDCNCIIVNCLIEAFNGVHPECKIEMDITPRVIEKEIPAWSKYYMSMGKKFAANPHIHSMA